MEIKVNDDSRFVVFSVKGRLDFASSTQLKEEILKFIRQGRTTSILNLAQVDFINSSGLGTLVSILKEVRLVRGRLVLSNLATYVQEIFDITQLSHIFEIFASEAEAREALAGTPEKVR